jgi:hypothetical protein
MIRKPELTKEQQNKFKIELHELLKEAKCNFIPHVKFITSDIYILQPSRDEIIKILQPEFKNKFFALDRKLKDRRI